MDEDALFEELYGEAAPHAEEQKPDAAPVEPAVPSAAAALYGAEALAIEEEAAALYGAEAAAVALAVEPGPAAAAASGAEAGAEQDAAQATADEEDEEDLVISLDENATSYEPTAGSRFQYQRAVAPLPPGAAGAPPAEAVGAAPGQHVDATADAPPVLPGFGGFGQRTAIGGIPRSAIPGLGGSMVTSVPLAPAGAPGGAAPGGGAGPGPPGRPAFRPTPRFNLADAVFPSQQRPGLPVKLPGQTRVRRLCVAASQLLHVSPTRVARHLRSPEEYREFLNLGHGDIFGLDVDAVVDAPWRYPGIDPGDFFNYGLNERSWKEYCARVAQFREEFMLQARAFFLFSLPRIVTLQARAWVGQIQTLDAAGVPGRRGPPPLLARPPPLAAGGDEGEGAPHTLGTLDEQESDAHYEAFVTSERAPRTQWQRHGSSWDHILVLANAELVFTDKEEPPSSSAGPPPKPAPPRPPPPARPPPPSAAEAAAAAARIAAQQQQQQEGGGGGGEAPPGAPPAEDGGGGGGPANGPAWLPQAAGMGMGMPGMPGMAGMAFPPSMMATAAAMGMPFGMPLQFMQMAPAGPSAEQGGLPGRDEPLPAQPPHRESRGPTASLAAGMDVDLPPIAPPRVPRHGGGPPDRGPPPMYDRGPPPGPGGERGGPYSPRGPPPAREFDHPGPGFRGGPPGPGPGGRYEPRGPPGPGPPGPRFDHRGGPPPYDYRDDRHGPPPGRRYLPGPPGDRGPPPPYDYRGGRPGPGGEPGRPPPRHRSRSPVRGGGGGWPRGIASDRDHGGGRREERREERRWEEPDRRERRRSRSGDRGRSRERERSRERHRDSRERDRERRR
eukprot:scaffold14.g1314.t1